MGPIAEKTNEWNYVLSDGVNTLRQLTDADGLTTLSVRYNPWGKIIETNGTGNFDASFIGTLIDATTGLIYVGNGQYYDPETGRFLTRGVNPNGTNPYVPWNPIGMIIGPLGLVSMYYSRKKGNHAIWVVVMILTLTSLACSMPCCGSGCGQTNTPDPVDTTEMPISTPDPVTDPGEIPSPTETPNETPTEELPCVNCNRNWLPNPFIITHYATVLENDTFFPNESGNVPIYDPPPGTGDVTYKTVPKWRFYVGNDCGGNCGNWRVSFQGSGKLTESESLSLSGGKQYVQADTTHLPPPDPGNGYQPSASYYFVDQPSGACGSSYPLVENATIAVAGNLFNSPDHTCGDKYYIDIPGFENTIFTVKDSGSYVVEGGSPDHFDIYVGAQTNYDYYHNPEFTKYDGLPFRVAKAQP